MTPSELKYNVTTKTDTFFFDHKSMKFFGDTMKNYGVRSAVIKTHYDEGGNFVGMDGVDVSVWELYRKKPVKHGLKESKYFRKDNFESTNAI